MQLRTVLAREQWLSLEHLCKDATRTPDVHRDVVLLPREHDLGCAVVPRRDVARHLRVLQSGETEIADLQIAVLIHEDVARFLNTATYVDRRKSGIKNS